MDEVKELYSRINELEQENKALKTERNSIIGAIIVYIVIFIIQGIL